ncbi:long-chain-fatty-acid--CoA ligase [Paenibacillus sp. FSL W7-1287]|uniref:long-chain-fatty-acid--CoA ligase n=1 Tax=Paenibacillus sp. FSL W7-1287 TaxID=2954538 RepID=UPI0030FB28D5
MDTPNQQPSDVQETARSESEQVVDFSEKRWLRYYPEEVRHKLDYPEINVAQFLIDAVTQYAKKPALTFMGKTLTYEQLYTSADLMARGLGRLGVKKGDRVAIMLPNCPQAVISYFGVLLAGAIVVQTNPLYVERELTHQLKDSGAVAMITLDMLYPRIARVRGKNPEEGPIPKLHTVVITSIKDGLPFPKSMLYPIKQRRDGFKAKIPYGTDGYVQWKSLLSRSALSYERPTLAGHHDIAALQYTGGTTGTPKGVMLTHRNLVSNTLQSKEWCERIRLGEERYLAALPLFHVFGLTVLMNLSVCTGGCLVLLPKFEVEEVLRTIDKQKPTIFPGAPTMYIALIQAASKQAKPLDLSSIEICISGSAALPLEVQDQFEKMTGGKLIEGYGLTESSPVTHANPIWGYRKIGTIGIPFPDTEAAVLSLETGQFLPPGEVGELVVRGPQVMSGYWNNEAATEAAFHNGWLRTGDMALMDHQGFFVIKDRIKDMIIASGFNIYPREIEEVLYEHPAIAEAAVIGVKDSYRGETVKAFVVLKDNVAVSDQQLNQWCRERLASYKVPHIYEFRKQLPKTMVGKVLKRQLMEEEERTNE